MPDEYSSKLSVTENKERLRNYHNQGDTEGDILDGLLKQEKDIRRNWGNVNKGLLVNHKSSLLAH